MAFGVEELRVLRRALALALHPAPASAEDIKDCHRLAESLDEAVREGARLRAFLVADLARYRAALPGTAAGYLTLLEEALGAGYRPEPDDLAALRALRGNPVAAALLSRCQVLAERDVRARLAGSTAARRARVAPVVPASRTRLLALPGGLSGGVCGGLPRPPGAARRTRTPRSRRSVRPGRRRNPRRSPPPPPSPPGGPSPPRARSSPPQTDPAPGEPATAPGRGLTRRTPPRPSCPRAPGYSGPMDYVSALVPPVVMAAFFIGLIRVIVKTQGGANKAKEDAAVDAALARAEGAKQASGAAGDA